MIPATCSKTLAIIADGKLRLPLLSDNMMFDDFKRLQCEIVPQLIRSSFERFSRKHGGSDHAGVIA